MSQLGVSRESVKSQSRVSRESVKSQSGVSKESVSSQSGVILESVGSQSKVSKESALKSVSESVLSQIFLTNLFRSEQLFRLNDSLNKSLGSKKFRI